MRQLWQFLTVSMGSAGIAIASGLSLSPTLAQNLSPAFDYTPPPPPDRGSPQPSHRGGASRGQCPAITAVVPEASGYGGYTLSAQPTLWVYVPQPLADDNQVQVMLTPITSGPTASGYLNLSAPAGLVPISLAALGLPELSLNVAYQWQIVVHCQRSHRYAMDGFAYTEGWIQRVSPQISWGSGFDSGEVVSRSQFYAAQGLWYDTIHVLAAAWQSDPSLTPDLMALFQAVDLDVQIPLGRLGD